MDLKDKYLPVWHFNERHSLDIAAPQANVMAAVQSYRPESDALLRNATALRELPIRLLDRLRGRESASRPPFGLDNFSLLEQDGDRQRALGLAGKFWQADYGQTTIANAADFLAFSQPGAAKLVLSFTAEALDSRRTRLTTETRVFCLDNAARRKFTPYWYLIRPVSGLIRLRILKSVSRLALTLPPYR